MTDHLARERFRTIVMEPVVAEANRIYEGGASFDDDGVAEGIVDLFPEARFEYKVNAVGVPVRRVAVASGWEVDPNPKVRCGEPTCPDFGSADFGEGSCPADHALAGTLVDHDREQVARTQAAAELARRFASVLDGTALTENDEVVQALVRAVMRSGHPLDAGPQHVPTRGGDVAAWIKRKRDQFGQESQYPDRRRWWVLDRLLDDYRDHADTGTPLDQDVAGPHGEGL